MKKSILCLLIMLSLSSCGILTSSTTAIIPEDDNNAQVMTKEIPFTNLSSDFNINGKEINTYYINNEDVPYIDVIEYIRSLDGFINCDESLRYKNYPNKNMLVLAYYYNNKQSCSVQFQWDTNCIVVDDFNFFSYITEKNQKTNYDSFIKYTNYESWSKKEVVFDIGAYYFDILYWNEKCLIPFTIANMLFCSHNQFNTYYTEENYYGYYGEISKYSDEYQIIYKQDTNGKEQSKAMRKATVNSFLFAMNYFYGLKKDKDIELFNNFVSDEDFDLLFSNKAEDNHKALKHIIYGQLDELHTRIDGRSIYSSEHDEDLLSLSEYGTFWSEYFSLGETQSVLREERLGETIPEVRYKGDTAIITLDEFVTGSNDEIYDSEGNVKDTAWQYDTYFYMRHCMDDIVKHTEVNDVVLDLSLNGGGNIGAMYRTLGFLTDKVLLDYEYDTLTNEYSCSHFKIDTDSDGYYDDDAYDQYRWTILSSMNSFSAANDFICKVKQQKLAKIIGNKSGGGMCSVLPLVLADGTAIAISSNNSNRFVKKEKNNTIYYSTEYGIKPDMKILYSDYYDDARLVEYVDAVYSE